MQGNSVFYGHFGAKYMCAKFFIISQTFGLILKLLTLFTLNFCIYILYNYSLKWRCIVQGYSPRHVASRWISLHCSPTAPLLRLIVHTWKLFEFRYLFLFLLNLSAMFSLMKSSNHARGLESNARSSVVRIRNTMTRVKKLGVNEYIYSRLSSDEKPHCTKCPVQRYSFSKHRCD